MSRECQFLETWRMLGLLQTGYAKSGRRDTGVNKLQHATCGKPAQWELVFNDFEPICVCAEHYEALTGWGWSELR